MNEKMEKDVAEAYLTKTELVPFLFQGPLLDNEISSCNCTDIS